MIDRVAKITQQRLVQHSQTNRIPEAGELPVRHTSRRMQTEPCYRRMAGQYGCLPASVVLGQSRQEFQFEHPSMGRRGQISPLSCQNLRKTMPIGRSDTATKLHLLSTFGDITIWLQRNGRHSIRYSRFIL